MSLVTEIIFLVICGTKWTFLNTNLLLFKYPMKSPHLCDVTMLPFGSTIFSLQYFKFLRELMELVICNEAPESKIQDEIFYCFVQVSFPNHFDIQL